ncbi:MAG: TonB-dependent receptor [Chitinophagales bacterium]|nr:TonB-dependent receptor [Chitinophagales bacterium]
MATKKNFFSCGLFLFFSVMLVAQPATLTGTITDAKTNEPLPGANVITNNGTGTSADTDGKYFLQLDSGNYTIEYRFIGYISQKTDVAFLPGETKELHILLQADAGILNTVVVSGSKFEKRISEETVTIDVIKADLIEHTNDIKLDKTVERIPGVNVIDGQANIRGGSGYSYGAGSRVLLLMDDLPILTGDAAYPSWDFIPMENIQQVEIIKGAASALYGSSALNGIINVRTAYPKSTPETKISFFNGAYFSPPDTLQKWWGNDFPFFTGASFSHKHKWNKFDFVAGAYVYSGDSYLQDVFHRRARANTNLRYRINGNLSVGVNVNTQLSKNASFFFWNNIDTGLYIPFRGTLTHNEGFKMTIDPYLHYYGKNGSRHKVLLRYYQNHNKNDQEQSSLSDLIYGEYQYQKHFEKINFVATGGVLSSYAQTVAELYGDTTYTTSNEAAYIQLDKKFLNKLNVSGGVRYEFNQIAGLQESRPVFRVGANYQAADYTFIRASWGQGYRFPTIAEKYISTNISILGIFPNPDLRSETGWSSELGIKQGMTISNWQGYADVSAFVSEYFDMMEFTFGYYPETGVAIPYGFKSLNIGNTRIQGIEISLIGEGKLGNIHTTILTGYTYIDPKFQEFDSVTDASSSADYNILKYRFKHTAKLDVECTIRKFRIGAYINYFSFMEAVDAAFVDPISPGSTVYIIPGLQQYRDAHHNGDFVMDVRLAYKINAANEISLLCNNLLNREYSVRPAMMEAPRNITIKYSVKL